MRGPGCPHTARRPCTCCRQLLTPCHAQSAATSLLAQPALWCVSAAKPSAVLLDCLQSISIATHSHPPPPLQRIVRGAAAGACVVDVLDGVRPGSMGWWHSLSGSPCSAPTAPPWDADIAEAAATKLPRSHKVTLRLVDEYLPAGDEAHAHTLCEWRIVITPPPAQQGGGDVQLLTGEEREEEAAAQAMEEMQAVMDALISCVSV